MNRREFLSRSSKAAAALAVGVSAIAEASVNKIDEKLTEDALVLGVQQERDRRDEALQLQRDLIYAQIEYTQKRINAIELNAYMCPSVLAEPSTPEHELEQMFRIMERIQSQMGLA